MNWLNNLWDKLARLLAMERSKKEAWICRAIIVGTAIACLCVMLLIGCCVKGADAEYPWPYVVFVDRPVQLTDWESVGELRDFLATDDTDSVVRLIAGADGAVNFYGQCEDRAFQLRGGAEFIGKRLETEILTRSECIRYQAYIEGNPYTLGARDGHVVCKAVIGDEYYFVEPANDKFWKAYNLD